MSKIHTLLLIFLIFKGVIVTSQNMYDIVMPGYDRDTKCQKFKQIFKNKPKEVLFSVKADSSNDLYFHITDKKWFNELFKTSGDGIAIDIVSKDRYNCNIDEITKSQIKGDLQKPVYAAQLKRGLKPSGANRFKVKIGKLPEALIGKDVEYNILFLSNRNLCMYYTIFDLEAYRWDLLNMGVYLDSLDYKSKLNTTKEKEGYTLKYKTLKFNIPFQKNKSNYSQDDIKPLYDSLRLTDFNIKKINIRAYSSVEGNLERNIELQEQRANSIVSALQSFQKPTIITEVFSSENWVEFLSDVTKTNYSNLADLTKKQIKNKLVGKASIDLEPYLKNHRKAIITLDLEKKDKYKEKSPNELLDLFNSSIANNKINEALEIQNSIFEKLKDELAPASFLDKMIVPKQVKYITILNKNAAFKYLLDKAYLLISFSELKKLEKLDPKNGKIKYNIAALKFRIWKHKAQPVNENTFKKEILALQQYGISLPLINRMLVNFHIIKSELFLRSGDYANKDKSVSYILKNYSKFPLSDSDYLSLTQYLSYYSNYKKAIGILENKVKSLNVDEDLLFYYLNLTLIDKELTQTSNYRTTMLNAVNMNKERFCKLFNAVGKGGVTFQLLRDEYLRKTYCENCEQ
ncbi:hypothetical protein SAMN05444411_10192 [Lutibacter oricola]|uniref:OmpA family protein n=1 Tax=Lutibacter oricola TaxID=762486 RepID=A0A1H2QW22_9FLAO|nr:hypothetical protein [Lutibacter oricola]SDW11325.1 hypothetical protein SAMN05444411_10192 [Lutibacter oricola]